MHRGHMSLIGGVPAPLPAGRRADLVTVSQAALTLRVSKSTVYRLIRAGELPAVRVGRAFRIQRQVLGKYVSGAIHNGSGDPPSRPE